MAITTPQQDDSLKMATEKVRFEHILDEVGSRGKFQILVGIVMLLVGLIAGLQNTAGVMLLYTPNYWCTIPGTEYNQTLNRVVAAGLNWTEDRIRSYAMPGTLQEGYSKCQLYLRNYTEAFSQRWVPENDYLKNTLPTINCDSWTYETKEFQSTVVTRWDLVCDSQFKASTAKSAYMMGILLGSLLWGFFSDRYGRRSCALTGIGVSVFAGILASFPIHYVVFVILRIVIGFGCSGVSSSLYVLLAEAVDLKIRGAIQMAYLSTFAFAMMALSPMAFYLNDWATLSLTISASSSLLALTYWLVPESARWYIIKGRFEDAYSTLQHVANVNGRHLDKDLLMQMIADCNRTEMRSAEVLDQSPYFKILADLFGKELRQKTFVLFFLWSVSAMVYYTMIFNIPSFGDNIFNVMFLSGATELPSYVLGIILIRYLPRKAAIIGCFVASAFFAFSPLLIPQGYHWIIAWTALACKFAISIAFCLLYIFTMEIFPTRHRHLALGACSTCARIGTIVVPYIVDALNEFSTSILMGIYGGLALQAAFASLWLPETKFKALPETIADTIDYESLEMPSTKKQDGNCLTLKQERNPAP